MNQTNAIFGISTTQLTANERDFFNEVKPFGFILFARNISSPNQLFSLINELREVSQLERPVILIDQEGGRVSRLPKEHWWVPPSPSIFGKLAKKSQEQAERACVINHRLIAHQLFQAEITVNCAPMLDVAQSMSADIIHERALGDSAGIVTTLGKAAIEGMSKGGIAAVIKHIPGHGKGSCDSHFTLPRVDAHLDELSIDFEPFIAMNNALMAMSAHIIFSQIDSELPASISPAAYEFMRDSLGFNGLIMTDDINMHALSGKVEERAKAALEAGADIALHCSGEFAEMKAISKVIDDISGTAKERADAVHQWVNAQQPEDIDVVEMTKELESLLNYA